MSRASQESDAAADGEEVVEAQGRALDELNAAIRDAEEALVEAGLTIEASVPIPDGSQWTALGFRRTAGSGWQIVVRDTAPVQWSWVPLTTIPRAARVVFVSQLRVLLAELRARRQRLFDEDVPRATEQVRGFVELVRKMRRST
jgi:hypothetical protein